MGGGTRVPRVQEELLKFFEEMDAGGRRKRELGHSLNTDEAAAMGAVFKAADLSAGFKVRVTVFGTQSWEIMCKYSYVKSSPGNIGVILTEDFQCQKNW